MMGQIRNLLFRQYTSIFNLYVIGNPLTLSLRAYAESVIAPASFLSHTPLVTNWLALIVTKISWKDDVQAGRHAFLLFSDAG